VALPAFPAAHRAAAQLLLAAGRAAIDRYPLLAAQHSSKPAAAAWSGRMGQTDRDGQTDGRTDGRTPDRCIDPAPHTYGQRQ